MGCRLFSNGCDACLNQDNARAAAAAEAAGLDPISVSDGSGNPVPGIFPKKSKRFPDIGTKAHMKQSMKVRFPGAAV